MSAVASLANPLDASSPLLNDPPLQSTLDLAVIENGKVEYGTQALFAEKAGAKAVLIIADELDLLSTFGAGSVGANVKIPVFKVNKKAGTKLITAIKVNSSLTVTVVLNQGHAGRGLKTVQGTLKECEAACDTEGDACAGFTKKGGASNT